MIRAVILAAGQGTRMHSSQPKMLHRLLGRPMVRFAVDTATQVTGSVPVVVVGHGADRVRQELKDDVEFVLQEEQLGTGHAVLKAKPLLDGKSDLVLVSYGDMPLLTQATMESLVKTQKTNPGPMTILTVVYEDPRGFGRVIRDAAGRIQCVIEEVVATPEQLKIRELNAGAYCFAAAWLWQALARLPLSPKGEYFLTDLVELAVKDGSQVLSVTTDDPVETIGINTRVHLAEAEAHARARLNRHWMLSGVTLIDPASTYIEYGVTIGQDTIIWPNTYLRGSTHIGEMCEIGPNAILQDSNVGKQCKILASVLESAEVEDDVDIGPFARLRKGAHLAQGVHMGNFGEIKNSTLGPGVKMGHFSYIGDATISANVNIGAGTITCNFDGEKKHATEIGEGAFIGSDTMLVAPVKIGARSRTGAGSVVTKDVPADTLVVGVPARPLRKIEKED
jgi:bifunctional UDP-N-acetylglucosamine pyrophosphorylase/glucosamine-1-phosphate N-acetyltransferase